MAKIMVVPRKKLFTDNHFLGFSDSDFSNVILSNLEYMEREKAEYNTDFKQPIAYCVIVNNGKVFAYQRAKKGNEKRLLGKWTIGVGGHMEKDDLSQGDPVSASLKREVEEEVDIGEYTTKILGYINQEDGVGKVHFGILYIALTDSKVTPKSSEIARGRFVDKQQLRDIFKKDVEGWSRIALNPVLEFLERA